MATRTVQEPGTRPAPTHHTRAGATLATIPNRVAKSLVSAGLAARDFEAQFLIEGHDGPFRVVTANIERDDQVLAARTFISGLLFALYPPDQLAATVRVHRSEWARFTGVKGMAVPGWSFGCGDPSCIIVASVRVAHQGQAVDHIETLGWYNDAQWGWLCPEHATVQR